MRTLADRSQTRGFLARSGRGQNRQKRVLTGRYARRSAGGVVSWFLVDKMGSTMTLTDVNGNIQTTYNWGRRLCGWHCSDLERWPRCPDIARGSSTSRFVSRDPAGIGCRTLQYENESTSGVPIAVTTGAVTSSSDSRERYMRGDYRTHRSGCGGRHKFYAFSGPQRVGASLAKSQ